jgi:Chaperone of endosialidase
MNPMIQPKRSLKSLKSSRLLLIPLLFGCFALVPMAPAVVPPPDGGYPGGNTAEGQNALLSRTTGGFNAAIGWLSLRGLTTGSFNTGIGAGTLALNNADQNTATGAGALLSNTIGSFNTAHGAFALFTNTEGGGNTANGVQALFHNTMGNANTATGEAALFNNTSGNDNTANGDGALLNNATGEGNVAIGSQALHSNTAGFQNTAVGGGALFSNTGNGNIAIGFNAGNNVSTANSVICIGAPGQEVSNSCYIGNIFNATSSAGTAVFINSDGKLGTTTSSKRFKKAIKPMDKASEAIFALKPVSFRYKKDVDPAGTSQLGLVAEDVEKVSPDLVVRDKEGKPYSVRYDQVNAMLLNEFLKEHKAFVQEHRKVQELEKRVEKLAAGMRKVSAQIELSNPAAQMAANQK